MKTWSLGVRSLLIAVATAVTLSADAEEKSVPEVAEYAAEMNGKHYATLAKAVQECPYDASETNEIRLLSDVEWEDWRTYEFYEASCISVGLFDPDSGAKRCEHGARSAECLQRAA